jgi:hypothetical protein
MLKTYNDFIAFAEEWGIMAFSGKYPAGLPVLDALTLPSQWHTGDPETDPWRWKDQAALEKRLAFGNILGGRKGFIAKALYPLFYSACRPDGDMEERYRMGYVRRDVYDIYRLFQDNTDLDTGEIRKAMHVTKKEGASAVDGAISLLQRAFYITVCGNRRKVAQDGMEYGWPANCYCLVDDWAADWLREPLVSTAEAKAKILAHCARLDSNADLQALDKLLFR